MKRTPIAKAAGLLACLALAAGVAGCRIHVDKGANGEDKNVQVDTPFGGIHVNTDQTTAADLGLPAYPGAQIFSFDGGQIHEISYRESQPFQLVSRFVGAPERYLNALFSDPGSK